MKKIIYFTLFCAFFITCKKDETTNSGKIDVYSNFLFNGNQLGVKESVESNVTWPWYLIKDADADNGDEIMMKFKSTKDGKSYAGFSISSNNGIPFKLGNNTKCTLSIVSGLDVYSCYDLTVNITKEATKINDCYEGTFSGNAKYIIGSQFPPITQNYPCSGSFRVPLKEKP